MKFDDVFDVVGEAGWFQLYAFVLISMFSAWTYHAVATPFVVYEMDHWCKVPELANLSWDQQKVLAVPLDKDGEYDPCLVYDLDYSIFSDSDFVRNTSLAVNGTGTRTCNSWVYNTDEYHESAVSKFDLVCTQNWLISFASTMYVMGSMFGAVTSGMLSDRFGRRTAVVICNMPVVIGGMMCAFAPHYAVFALGRFMCGYTRVAIYAIGTVFLIEMMGPRYRNKVGMAFVLMFSVGFGSLPWIAKSLKSDTYFQLAISVPCIVYTLYWWILPESPRWLIVNKKYKEANKALEWIAKWNGKTIPEDFDVQEIEVEKEDKTGSRKTLFDVFKGPVLRKRIFVVFYAWFTVVLQYYAVAFNTQVLPGDIYMNTFIIAMMEVPGVFITVFLADWKYAGRKRTIFISILVPGICGFIALPLQKYGQDQLLLAVIFIGRIFLATAFGLLFVYTTELFPTEVRNSVLGAGSTMGRVSGMMAAFIGGPLAKVWWGLPNIIFGIMGTTSGLLCLLLPETLGQKLCETIDEAEKRGGPEESLQLKADPDGKAENGV